jgi:deoxycytidylate deaminase
LIVKNSSLVKVDIVQNVLIAYIKYNMITYKSETELPALWKRGFYVAKEARLFSITNHYSQKIGSALFNGNKLISIGYNMYHKTHTAYGHHLSYLDHDKCIHSECVALCKRRYFNDYNLILYIYREHADHTPACSKPCRICHALIKLAGVRKIRYIDKNGFFVEEKI